MKIGKKHTTRDTLVFRNSKKFRVTIDDFYDWFYYYDWSKDRKSRITKKKYKLFLTTFFELICNRIVRENYIFHMPYKLGSIFFKRIKKKAHQKTIDFGHLRKTGEKRTHNNAHSFGYRYRGRWDKRLAYFYNSSIYTFHSGNYINKLLYRVIKERSEDPNCKSYTSH